MGLFGPSESERKQEAHNRGQEEGSKADFIQQVGQSILGGLLGSEEYDKGFENGVKNQPKDKS